MKKDPRITAYALGEIGAAEREQFEKEMAESDLLQSEVDAMLHLGNRLEALPKDTNRFDSATREKLITEFANNQKARKTGRNPFILVLTSALGVAAALAFFVAIFSPGGGSGPWANGAYYPDSENQKSLMPGRSGQTKESSLADKLPRQALRIQATPGPKIEPREAGAASATYTVVEGDTIFTVAEKFGVTPEALLEANKLEDTNNLPVGTVLKVPEKKNQRLQP